MVDPVRAQYEALPYPPRDPRDEAKRLVTGSPSHLAELTHYVRGGRFDPARPFRALVAGGGTGDAAIMLAQQLVWAGATAAETVYLDASEAARRIAEARAAARGLAGIRFVTASLLDLPSLGLGRFDYVDCCGVLHHLPDPEAGLTRLVEALAPEGGMGLMLYGRHGRAGVYEAQAMLRTLAPPREPIATQLDLARRLVRQLPPTNALRRNPFVDDHLTQGDAGIYDLLLHARDRAYDVEEIAALTARAGLRIVAFVPPARYDPANYLSDAALIKRLGAFSYLDRAAFAERLAGNLKSHVFYVVRADNDVLPPDPRDRDVVPVAVDLEADIVKGLKPGAALAATLDGTRFSLAMPGLAPAILPAIDGKRTLGEIHAALVERRRDLAWDDFAGQFVRTFAALNSIGKLMLRR